jgi:hypothetical protein
VFMQSITTFCALFQEWQELHTAIKRTVLRCFYI